MQYDFTKLIIAIAFDGTCVTNEYPKVGKDIGAQEVLRKLEDRGVRLILNTMRSGRELSEAVEWFHLNEISLWHININPEQKRWTKSPKAYAHIYIDDSGLGVPLYYPPDGSRPFVDWSEVDEMFDWENS